MIKCNHTDTYVAFRGATYLQGGFPTHCPIATSFLIHDDEKYSLPVIRLTSNIKLASRWVYSEISTSPRQIKHWTLRQLGYLVLEHLSRKSASLLFKLTLLFIDSMVASLGNYRRFLEVSTPLINAKSIWAVSEKSHLARTKKKKRSIRRSYRSRLFFSKKGRIWLT